MKKIIPIIAGLLTASATMAQLPNGSTAPDFTLTDLNGTSWNLYTVLAQGKTVFIDVSATWCGPCWAYHNSHALEDLYNHYGPTGTIAPNSVMVFFIEGDGATSLQDMQGTGTNTQGNWVQGTPYPMFNPATSSINTFNSNYAIGYFPTIYRICPDKKVFEAGQVNEAGLLATINTCAFTVDAGVQSVANISSVTCSSSVTPSATIRNGGSTALTSCTVNYDIDGVNPQTYSWTGSLATNATAVVSLPSMAVTTGSHTLHVSTSNPNGGADQNSANNYSNTSFLALGSGPGQSAPVVEGFVASTFPPAGFGLGNPDGGTTWARSTAAGGFGNSTNSTMYDAYNYSATGEKDELQLPAVDLSAASNATMTFNVAYAAYDATYFEQLEVFVSTNCGSTWTSLYNKSGSVLATAPNATTAFTPSSSQWRAETISLNSYLGQNKVLVKFVATNGYGNNLYLDDINITGTTGLDNISLLNGFEVYPNPVNENATLAFELTKGVDVTVNIYSVAGTLVSTQQLGAQSSGAHKINLSTIELGAGMYFVELKAGEARSLHKITVSR